MSSQRPPRSRFLTANRLVHHLLEWDGDGPVVLLVHGFLEHAHAWDFVAPHVAAAGFRVAALDWRGHGDSDWVGAGGYYHFADYAADLGDVVRALGGRVALVGHSMGANAALQYAGTEPARVTHLLGVEVPQAEIETLLTSVGFTVAPKDDRLAVQVPGWRPDVAGALVTSGESASLPIEFPRALGNAIRHNSFVRNQTDGVVIGSRGRAAGVADLGPAIAGTVVEFNVVRDAQAAYHAANGCDATVFRRNHAYFWQDQAAPNSRTAFRISRPGGATWVDENTVEGVSAGGHDGIQLWTSPRDNKLHFLCATLKLNTTRRIPPLARPADTGGADCTASDSCC